MHGCKAANRPFSDLHGLERTRFTLMAPLPTLYELRTTGRVIPLNSNMLWPTTAITEYGSIRIGHARSVSYLK